ncbi:MAG: Hsp20/alpha crystallin family protein [Betaproteobacteria bacterium]
MLADLPGIGKEAIQVDLHENTLTISAERKEEKNTDGTPVWRERTYGRLTRSLQLPQAVDQEDVQAVQANGTLRLVLAKRSVRETRRIQIAREFKTSSRRQQRRASRFAGRRDYLCR